MTWQDTPPEPGNFFYVRHERMNPTMAFRLGSEIFYFGEDIISDGREIENLPDSTEYKPVPSARERAFVLSEKQVEQAEDFIEEQREKGGDTGTAGDRFSYSFAETGIGIMARVVDNSLNEDCLLDRGMNY